jgi:hypothetical protein
MALSLAATEPYGACAVVRRSTRLLPVEAHEGFEMMSMRKISLSSTGRAVLLASIAAFVLTVAEPPPAAAGQVSPASKGVSATGSSDATDFSAARRRRHYRRGGNAAGLAFMGLAIGTIGAIAAQQRRDDYYNNGYYNNGYYNNDYGYGPGYYGGGPYYGRRYNRY